MTMLDHPPQNLEFRQGRVEFRIVHDGKAQGRVLADVLRYNKVDDYRTAFRPGTFAESLKDHLPTMVWGHNWLEPIGQWIEADDNNQRMRLLGQLDLDLHENGQMLVPQAHRAWLQMQKRTVNQFSIGFVRLADQPHREVRGATEITKGWLDEVSPVVVGSVPGTSIVSTRAMNRANLLSTGERRNAFKHESRAPRNFSADLRKEYAEKGIALPDGSYPIPDKGALRRAIQSFGRATNKGAVKAHIIKRAKALGATDLLPADWQ